MNDEQEPVDYNNLNCHIAGLESRLRIIMDIVGKVFPYARIMKVESGGPYKDWVVTIETNPDPDTPPEPEYNMEFEYHFEKNLFRSHGSQAFYHMYFKRIDDLKKCYDYIWNRMTDNKLILKIKMECRSYGNVITKVSEKRG